jgi:hypothetical protein
VAGLDAEMDDEFDRETQPSGALEPPSRKPPTAVGVATPGPGPEGGRSVSLAVAAATPNWLGRFVSRTLDIVDELGDVVAEVLHVRPRHTGR